MDEALRKRIKGSRYKLFQAMHLATAVRVLVIL